MTQFPEEKSERSTGILRRKEAEESTRLLAQKYGIPYVDLSVFPVEVDAIKIVPESAARAGGIAVFQITGARLKIAVRNPDAPETAAQLRSLAQSHYDCDLFLASPYAMERAWSFYKKVPERHVASAATIEVSGEKLAAFQREMRGIPELKTKIEASFSGVTSEALEIILAGALAIDASDIHIEPQGDAVRLRLRMDGVLRDITKLPTRFYQLLLSRIKLVSEMKLNIRDRAQDGRFTIHSGADAIEVRTSALPGPDGENIVMRVLNPRAIEISFQNLGMQPWVGAIMEAELKKPNGLILTTGPTGSGKTTTLYTFLRSVRNPGIKIITIEDPIEYHLSGIEQTQVDQDKGYDFANGLRSIVRQDPDVILVGEIRDLETAETAMHAALTGHLVFSTLHTNDAAGTIPRLLDLGVKPAIIAPAVNVAMAQRLVRKLCAECRRPVMPDEAMKKNIAEQLAAFPENIRSMPDALLPENKWTIFSAAETGCGQCNGAGYRGRTGVYEIIVMNDETETLILKSASGSEIKKEALRQGQITMRQDALLKVLAGITDFAEVERTVG